MGDIVWGRWVLNSIVSSFLFPVHWPAHVKIPETFYLQYIYNFRTIIYNPRKNSASEYQTHTWSLLSIFSSTESMSFFLPLLDLNFVICCLVGTPGIFFSIENLCSHPIKIRRWLQVLHFQDKWGYFCLMFSFWSFVKLSHLCTFWSVSRRLHYCFV